ncbi:MAG: hypothetical protein Q4D87_04495 [Actinomycetaceae bacterium]|nr:hypothetical protein [Actinomycetaceae bacterium]
MSNAHYPSPGQGANPWRTVWKSMRENLPVNKFPGQRRSGRKMPSIENPLIVGGLGVAALGAGAAVKYLRPMGTSRQDAQLQQMLLEKLGRVPGLAQVGVDTKQGFGKPLLVRVGVVLNEMPVSPTDLLERACHYVWDNAPKTPVAVSVTVTSPGEQWTLADLDFEDEVARPHELYERFGAPASDPGWKP